MPFYYINLSPWKLWLFCPRKILEKSLEFVCQKLYEPWTWQRGPLKVAILTDWWKWEIWWKFVFSLDYIQIRWQRGPFGYLWIFTKPFVNFAKLAIFVVCFWTYPFNFFFVHANSKRRFLMVQNNNNNNKNIYIAPIQ